MGPEFPFLLELRRVNERRVVLTRVRETYPWEIEGKICQAYRNRGIDEEFDNHLNK